MSMTSSNPKPISPLRARMIEDMTVRNFAAGTQREYIRAVKKLAGFIDLSPDTATAEELRAFQLHLTKTGATPPTINATVTALRFFFKVTLDRPETTRFLVFVHEPRKLPRVLSPEEVLRLLEAAPNPKYKAALSVAYGAGLRAMEVVALKVTDIDSQRMLIRVEQGKGRGAQVASCGSAPLIGPLCHAVAAASGAVAGLVPDRAASHLSVPWPGQDRADDDAPVEPHLPYGGGAGRAAEVGRTAHAPAFLCNPST
jgi:integrase